MKKLVSVLILSLGIQFNLYAQATAQDKLTIHFFSGKQIHKLLGDYPATGSVEEAQDFQTLLDYQISRTSEDCDYAASQAKATLTHMFVDHNGPLTKSEARWHAPLFWQIYIDAGININTAKKEFKRPRPFITDSDIEPCIELATSYAYPSGHTALARVFARVLSDLYPERAAAFMQRADEVALNRVIGGVHHPSDIVAGKKLGDAIYQAIQSNH